MKESEYELLYLHCLSLKCPLPTPMSRSLGGLSQKGVTQALEKFGDIKRISKSFLQYCNDKGKNYFMEDVEDYLAWKIWQHKIQNPNAIKNPKARIKAQFINDKAIEELHKSASRIKRRLTEISAIKELPSIEHKGLLEKILSCAEKEAQVAVEIYNTIIENHNLALQGLDNIIINQLEGNE